MYVTVIDIQDWPTNLADEWMWEGGWLNSVFFSVRYQAVVKTRVFCYDGGAHISGNQISWVTGGSTRAAVRAHVTNTYTHTTRRQTNIENTVHAQKHAHTQIHKQTHTFKHNRIRMGFIRHESLHRHGICFGRKVHTVKTYRNLKFKYVDYLD